MSVGHLLIARPDKMGPAKARLNKAGIYAQGYPAITPPPCFGPGVFAKGYARFGGGEIARAGGQHGAALSHLGAMGMARGMGWEWVGLWEEDADAEPGMGWRDLEPPTDCGAIYLGGILWGLPTNYGKQIGERLWQVTEQYPISGTHALMLNAIALDDVIASCACMDMTADDCVSRACMEATATRKWSTCFVWPWMAWQIDRPESWPR